MIEIEANKWKEECSVFGVYSHEEDVSMMTYLGLYALQHRGQESAEDRDTDGTRMDVSRGMGLVNEVFRHQVPYGQPVYCNRSCEVFDNRFKSFSQYAATDRKLFRWKNQFSPCGNLTNAAEIHQRTQMARFFRRRLTVRFLSTLLPDRARLLLKKK